MDKEKRVLNAGRMTELGKAALEHFKKENVDASLIKAFSAIFYFIMDNVISRFKMNQVLSLQDLRKYLKEDIDDYTFYSSQMRSLRKNRTLLHLLYSPQQTEEIIDILDYLANGNMFFYIVKRKIKTHFMRVV